MKKLVLLILVATMFANITNAQIGNTSENELIKSKKNVKTENSNCNRKGSMIFSAGFGVPNFSEIFAEAISVGFNESTSNKIGILHGKADFGLGNLVSMGVVVNYNSMNTIEYRNGDKAPFRYTSLAISLRTNFHYYTDDKWDAYVGAGIGYKKIKYSRTENPNNNTFLVDDKTITNRYPYSLEGTAGVRFFPIKMVGFYAELGLAQSILQAGISVKLS
jgi:opacity protein-like surface antigen